MDQSQLDKMKAELLHDEGYRQYVYLDIHGVPTVGIGRNLRTRGISKDEALFLLQNDIRSTWNELTTLIPWIVNLNDVRQRVIVNLAFNLGVTGLMGFKDMLKKCRLGQFKEAGEEILDSKAGRELKNRYSRLALEMATGTEYE